tara:strand:- start:753 stop:938 length:186 start_codon:yes stop_codon:yes gene_type:complete
MGYIIDVKHSKNAINITFFTILSIGVVFYNDDSKDKSFYDFILFQIQLWKLQISIELGVNK